MNPAQVFDGLAADYDKLWTHTLTGQLQREAFWSYAGPYVRDAASVLDIGCGTGEDAVRLAGTGVRVVAIDVAPQMAAIARSRGMDARVLPVQDAGLLDESFDVAMSNFGPLNCVPDLAAIRAPLAQVVKRGG